MRHRFVRRFLSLGPMGAADIQTVNPGGGATAGHLPGLVTGTIGAGFIGEFLGSSVAVGSPISLSTATPANVTSISLSNGQWLVSWALDFILSGATGTQLEGGPGFNVTVPSQVPTATFLSGDTLVVSNAVFTTLTSTVQLVGMPQRTYWTTGGNLFLVAQATFTVGTVSVYGSLSCVRCG